MERPPSEMSASTVPRPPMWNKGSNESIEDISALSGTSKKQYPDHRSDRKTTDISGFERSHNESLRSSQRSRSSVMGFIKRTFSVKSKTKPADRNYYQNTQTPQAHPERPQRRNHGMKIATSQNHTPNESANVGKKAEYCRFQSLPRKSSVTTLQSRIRHNSGTGAINYTMPKHRSNSNNRAKGSVFLMDKCGNQSKHLSRVEEQPEAVATGNISAQQRSLSQPSILTPELKLNAAEEPFTHYANLPFQLPVRVASSSRIHDLNADDSTVDQRAQKPWRHDQKSSTRPRQDVPLKSTASEATLINNLTYPERKSSGGNIQSGSNVLCSNEISGKQRGILKHCDNKCKSYVNREQVKNNNVCKEQSLQDRTVKNNTKASAPHERPTEKNESVFRDIANIFKTAFKHRKHGDEELPEGYDRVTGDGLVSEKFTKISNIHEENEDVREEEEVHHLGDYTNEDVSRAVREGGDALALVRRVDSDAGGRLVPVDNDGRRRRVVHEASKTWRTVDTEDVHEKSRRDQRGELHTETQRTKQREQFSNVQVPDDDSDAEDGSEEHVQTCSRNRRHIRDEDMMEYFSVPKGGRLGDGMKLGEGVRYVQENVEESREGDDIESLSQQMTKMRQVDFRNSGKSSNRFPIEYHEEDKARRKETHKWLESHFGSESGHSQSSEEDGVVAQRHSVSRNPVDEVDYTRGEHRIRSQRPTQFERKEKYRREVHETPERIYVREYHESPEGGYDRVKVTPVETSSNRKINSGDYTSLNRRYKITGNESLHSDRSRANRSIREVHFDKIPMHKSEKRYHSQGLVPSPPRESPPPPPPPRYKRKSKEKLAMSQSLESNKPDSAFYASSPIRDRHRHLSSSHDHEQNVRHHKISRDNVVRHSSIQHLPSYRESTPVEYEDYHHPRHRSDERGVREFHFRDGVRQWSSKHDTRDGHSSHSRPRYYLGVDPRTGGRDRSLSTDELDKSGGQREGNLRPSRNDSRYNFSQSINDHATRINVTSSRANDPAMVEVRTVRSQTMPRKPSDRQNRIKPSKLVDTSSRFGGSMINVSNVKPIPPSPPAKPYRATIQRSNSMYSHNAEGNRMNHRSDIGLKSPNIISSIQRSTSVKRDRDYVDAPRQQENRAEVHWRNAQNTGSMPVLHNTIYARPLKRDVSPLTKPKPKPSDGGKQNFMRGLMQTAPELYGILHGDERKDSKTPSPKHSPTIAPSSPLQRARSPTSPLGVGRAVFPRTPPVFKRIERLRADEEVVTKEGRSRSATPSEENVRNIRPGSQSYSSDRPSIHRYCYNGDIYTSPRTYQPPAGDVSSHVTTHRHESQTTRPRQHAPQYLHYRPRHENGAVVIEVRDWNTR